MDNRTLLAFSNEFEKTALWSSIGKALASPIRGGAIKAFGQRMGSMAQHYMPTFSAGAKGISKGVLGAAGTVAAGAAGLGAYGIYKGMKETPQVDMTGY